MWSSSRSHTVTSCVEHMSTGATVSSAMSAIAITNAASRPNCTVETRLAKTSTEKPAMSARDT